MRRFALLLFVALLLAPAPAWATLVYEDDRTRRIRVADDDGSSPRSLGRGERPVVSPDGRLVAYSADVADDIDAGGRLVIASVEGSAPPRALILDGEAEAFSPDSQTLVASQLRTGGRTFAFPVAGGPGVQLSKQLSTVAGFPDPATVVLSGLGFEESGRAPVVQVPLAGGEPRTLATEGYGRSALSPQGRLAYAQLDRRGDGTSIRLAGPDAPIVPARRGRFLLPRAWLPDGSAILVERRRRDDHGDTRAALLLDPRTGRLRSIADRLAGVGPLSRDGRFLLATRRSGGSRILRITLRSGRVRVLVRRASAPSWSR